MITFGPVPSRCLGRSLGINNIPPKACRIENCRGIQRLIDMAGGCPQKGLQAPIGYEGNAFASSGNVVDDLLSITSVHPLREETVKALWTKTGNDWGIVMTLINEGRLKETDYEGKRFYVRALSQSKDDLKGF